MKAASQPSKEATLPAVHVYKGQDSNHISDDAKTKTKTTNTQEHRRLHLERIDWNILGQKKMMGPVWEKEISCLIFFDLLIALIVGIF